MKFDCYKRFLKSDIYKNFIQNTLNDSKVKTKGRNKRRAAKPKKGVLISCHRINAYEKNENFVQNDKNTKVNVKTAQNERFNYKSKIDGNDIQPKRSHSTRIEPLECSKSGKLIKKSHSYHSSDHFNNENCRYLRVYFPDGSHEKVYLYQSQTIGHMVQKLLLKKKLNYSSFEAFIIGSEIVSIFSLKNYLHKFQSKTSSRTSVYSLIIAVNPQKYYFEH
jgi:hypothetical protein